MTDQVSGEVVVNEDLANENKMLKLQLLFAQRQALQAGIVASQYQLRDVEAEIQKCQQPGTTIPTASPLAT